MINYNNIVSFKKSSIIFIEDNYPKKSFYVIRSGKAVSYGKYFDSNMEYTNGDILGLVNSVLNEPYFFNVKADTDIEALEINVDDIINIYNKDLIKKMHNYLENSLEIWLSKYYINLSHNHSMTKYDINEGYVLNLAQVYNDNNFPTAAYEIYNQYLKFFPNSSSIKDIKDMIASMKEYNLPEPEAIEDNIFYYKKGYCLYTEFMASNYLYLINSGKVGVYNVINSKLVTRAIYSSNNLIDGYIPDITYQPLSTTTIVLEDSKIKLLKKEEFISIVANVNSLRPYYLQIICTKIRNSVLKVMALSSKDIFMKLLITIYYIVRTESLFLNKDVNTAKLLYKLQDIAAVIGYNNDINMIKNELKKIRFISIDDENYIHILDINNFIKEYEIYKKRLSLKKS
ncbi:cyclic nucleotide-binding domain-containing protein [Brachyspira murdochii]|uniref:Putative transcriptional regulator, Crp/Fnr family n=2 Tax=Brachyspira murdochii TaxID=84378 RepID=D5U5Z1_BRAM5|nr:cyclic nucleotide-binding domain-containing protein [Brachyspira murdochii]ADG70482.1 putative transcriptional regulator, Crp/Fnr family [Brachyspira murdochii DSM 12563]